MSKFNLTRYIRQRSSKYFDSLVAVETKTSKFLSKQQFKIEWKKLMTFEAENPLIPDKLEVIDNDIKEALFKYIRDNYINFLTQYKIKYNLVELMKNMNYMPSGKISKRQSKRKIPKDI